MRTFKANQSVKVGPFDYIRQGEEFKVEAADSHINLLIEKGILTELVEEKPVVEVVIPVEADDKATVAKKTTK